MNKRVLWAVGVAAVTGLAWQAGFTESASKHLEASLSQSDESDLANADTDGAAAKAAVEVNDQVAERTDDVLQLDLASSVNGALEPGSAVVTLPTPFPGFYGSTLSSGVFVDQIRSP